MYSGCGVIAGRCGGRVSRPGARRVWGLGRVWGNYGVGRVVLDEGISGVVTFNGEASVVIEMGL